MEVIRHGVLYLVFIFGFFVANFVFASAEEPAAIIPAVSEDSPSQQALDSILRESHESSSLEDVTESISPFLPIVNLKYHEVHVPITDNFSIDLYRTYSSQVYDQYPFKHGLKDARNYHEQIWQLHPGYIVASMPSY